ncbi:helix-turn-helix transcriptional regulator [Blastococcus sp. CT_GayMR16]|uniref:helix-turn-helix domain-containing protein n=1 Tax=Blastococcus sp. CT_GayMR16 TaxID=2559607 RepID=UPI001073F02B|nr:helix-turn-helix transcriptional regulator [Blastococcus sp. CT_GayMR16]TFV90537.1 XRE family transcriptional regulator [Blastococcus sp. CT_GayMR16]
MAVDSPSVRERQLARELRQLRSAQPLHGKDVAAHLGWSASKVSRIETGRIGISPEDLDLLLALYDVPDDQATYLRRLAPSARPRGWWDAYADTLSSGYANLIRLEAGSGALRCYGALVPHALLQTPEYVRQVILSTWERPSQAEIDRRMQVCRRRQDVLEATTGDGPMQFSAVLDESVLRRGAAAPGQGDGATILRAQLDWFATVAVRPNVTIQVLPFDAGLPPVTAGSFSVLESRATGAPDVVYLENKTRVFFIDAEAEVHRYTQAFELLSSMALDPEQSLELIGDIAATL